MDATFPCAAVADILEDGDDENDGEHKFLQLPNSASEAGRCEKKLLHLDSVLAAGTV